MVLLIDIIAVTGQVGTLIGSKKCLPKKPQKVDVWAGIIGGRIICLNQIIPPCRLLFPGENNVINQQIWLQEDGAPPHFVANIREYLRGISVKVSPSSILLVGPDTYRRPDNVSNSPTVIFKIICGTNADYLFSDEIPWGSDEPKRIRRRHGKRCNVQFSVERHVNQTVMVKCGVYFTGLLKDHVVQKVCFYFHEPPEDPALAV
ncbi:hypothetical protein NQ318_012699 [Aromia moschata]|uniref:Uncharacterized protein n=1 Tax=Aromia moschata TaxID=1265417 RepID=A0AAV8YJL0_9CUCU|nr:hypothetical protein NQ318_012699 [Aromia moschata]